LKTNWISHEYWGRCFSVTRDAYIAALLFLAWPITGQAQHRQHAKDFVESPFYNVDLAQAPCGRVPIHIAEMLGDAWQPYLQVAQACRIKSQQGILRIFAVVVKPDQVAENASLSSSIASGIVSPPPPPEMFDIHHRDLGPLPDGAFASPQPAVTISFEDWIADWPERIALSPADPSQRVEGFQPALFWHAETHSYTSDPGL
jgi:hypothetical protein